MISLKDWMSRKIVTITKDKTVFEAAKHMDELGIGSLIVMRKDELQGIMTERDIIRKVVARGLNPHEVLVAEIMSEHVHTADVETNLLDIAKTMLEQNFRRIVVTENGKVAGIITARDLIKLVSPHEAAALKKKK